MEVRKLVPYSVGHMNSGDIPWPQKIGQKYMESVPPIERAIDLAIFVDSEYGS